MGVPRFFSWITRRYPLCLQDLDQHELPVIDCLYLDMNGIIYRCAKDQSVVFKAQLVRRELEVIWLSVFNYVCAIVDSIGPKRLLFLAFDGVAPRAKMNNQRSRRFQSANEYKQLSANLQRYASNEQEFQHNCITPGTEFMSELNRQLRCFIAKKIQEDASWRKFDVVFSGADVPGEGQHKIMDFIRQCRKLGVYHEQASHCLYGADADLIMLAMSLRVKHMCIIREHFGGKSRKVTLSEARNIKAVRFQLVYVNLIKQYFDLEYNQLRAEMKIPYDCQRVLNDFVFLCFFVGNDFLPRCYCYDIRDGNLEVLVAGFKRFLKVCGDYIIHEDHINMRELQRLAGILAEFEKDFIGDRSEQTRKAIEGADAEVKKEAPENPPNDPRQAERKFLLQLKALYTSDTPKARELFYLIKLKFSPAKQPEKLTGLLDSYVRGLHYVHQYYFGGLPSWDWYYPHYYAPLVGDLHQYLSYMNTNERVVQPFEKSQPYQPFKQLLCILPKESFQLLPKCLQPLVTQSNSPLRQPIDFFPDQAEVDPYGGLRQHEFITLLPFIDRCTVTEVYDEVAKRGEFTPEELQRNCFRQNELYQFNPHTTLMSMSTCTQIKDFTVPLLISPLDFTADDVLKLNRNLQAEVQSKLVFPSLYTRKFSSALVASKYRDQSTIEITLNEDLIPVKLGEQVYFGYPFETHGRVMAIAEQSNFRSLKEFQVLDFFPEERDLTDKDFRQQRNYWNQARQKLRQRGLQLHGDRIYYIWHSQLNYRKVNGEFARSYLLPSTLQLIVDAEVVSTVPKYSHTEQLYKPKDIREEFVVGEEVVVLKEGIFVGSKSIVMGYQHRQVCVAIIDMRPNVPPQLLRTINSNAVAILAVGVYFSLKFVANILRLDTQIVLDMLDSVQVVLDKSLDSAKGMPEALDIGLNLIRRYEKKLVPTLVRLPNQGAKVQNLYKAFWQLELSLSAVNLLCEYKQIYTEIFGFMQKRATDIIADSRSSGRAPNWRSEIKAAKIYPYAQDANESVIRLYVWLLKRQEIHVPNASLNSKAIAKNELSALINHFKTVEEVCVPSTRRSFDPNHLYSKRLSEKGVVHLSKRPPAHTIGDRVVCMHPAFFGERALIVGVDHNQYEVIFERPSFGKSDLGGKVDCLWGGKFSFHDLFNMSVWPALIEPRFVNDVPTTINVKEQWNGSAPEFVTAFRNRAVTTAGEYMMLVEKIGLTSKLQEFMGDREQLAAVRKPRPQELREEKLISKEVVEPSEDLKKLVCELTIKKEASLKEVLESQQIEVVQQKVFEVADQKQTATESAFTNTPQQVLPERQVE